MSGKYDVLIVGAGLGGALLAYKLSCMNLKVLLIEKDKLPRYKPCGGGLTKRAMDILPFNISEVIEDRIFVAKLYFRNKTVAEKTTNYPMINMVMRDRFDHFIVQKALKAGARIHENTVFKNISGSVGDLKIETSRGIFLAPLIVGADGVGSTVAKCLGLWKKRAFFSALEGEVFYKKNGIIERHRNTVHFDFGIIPQGYGCVFPKKENLSIGVLTNSKKINHLRYFLESYMKQKDLYLGAEFRSLRRHFIPFGPQRGLLFANNRGLLVGDAAGLTDPMTGEGLYYAIREAEIASKIISHNLKTNHINMKEYNSQITREIMNDLVYAKRLRYFTFKFPEMSYKIFRSRIHELSEFHIDIISGTRSYRDLYRKISNIHKALSVLSRKRDKSMEDSGKEEKNGIK